MTTVSTKRLTITPHTKVRGNIEKQVRWLNDPEVTKYSERRHEQHDFNSQYFYVDSFLRPNELLEIYETKPHRLIGTMTVYVDKPNSVADIGIMIGDKTVWGQGYGYEAWAGVCDDLFRQGIRKIEAGAMAINKPMIDIFKKYKMMYEGTRYNHFIISNIGYINLVMHGRFVNA